MGLLLVRGHSATDTGSTHGWPTKVQALSGKLVRLVRAQGSIIGGHEFRELGNDNVLVDSYVPETADLTRFGGPARAAVVSAGIQELDPKGRALALELAWAHLAGRDGALVARAIRDAGYRAARHSTQSSHKSSATQHASCSADNTTFTSPTTAASASMTTARTDRGGRAGGLPQARREAGQSSLPRPAQ
jgi:hypothetical protein